jgi:hypothetical protein
LFFVIYPVNLKRILPKLLTVMTAGSLVLSAEASRAQTVRDTTHVVKDTTVRKSVVYRSPLQIRDSLRADSIERNKPFQPNPKKSGLYSALVPGLGQLYNRQYWKLPIVYAGAGTATYFIVKNLNDYHTYRKAYIGRFNNPFPTDEFVKIYTTDQLKTLQDGFKKDLDLAILFSGLAYALQIVDAITSAHLKNFDMSRDISLHLAPKLYPSGAGMGLVMNFK